MSYGEWRKRGKGWASLEIDSPWKYSIGEVKSQAHESNYRLESGHYDNPGNSVSSRIWREKDLECRRKWRKLERDLENSGLVYCRDTNVNEMKWKIQQAKKNRVFVSCWFGGGEHKTVLAFDDRDAVARWKRKTLTLYEHDEADLYVDYMAEFDAELARLALHHERWACLMSK